MLESRRRAALAFMMAAVLASLAAYSFYAEVATVAAGMGAEEMVLVAARPIPAWVPITAADLARRPVAGRYLLPGLMTDPLQVVGRVLLVPLAEGEPLVEGLIRTPGDLPPGQRVVTLVSGEGVVLEPGLEHGDRVDVLASYSRYGTEVTEVYLQDIPVLALQPAYRGESSGDGEVAVSLLVTLEEARRLVYVENYGRQLRLLRRPVGEGQGAP